ncbi:molecular chaperone [Desulfitobacterium sp. PCE1]|uniref:TorD/DmsD family molecular chaperone n=1 Tax=Desulfitobacterium sp. PCE1 TaxID=146907 RepID=UPI00037F0C17|nr:molecular chaperone TorD family protein [Desulfitobacterium sp. PCE1]
MPEREGNARERALGYELLAGIFLKEPTLEQFRTLQNWAAGLEDSSLKELLREIEEGDPELQELLQTYYDLFFVPVSGRFVPPFEAAIRGAQRQKGRKIRYGGFWGDSTLQVRQIYQQIGFEPEKMNSFQPLKEMNIPDHIGFELSALACLCQAEASWEEEQKDLDSLHSIQKILLEEHLNQWLDHLREDLAEADPTGFYTYFARLAAEFCREEVGFLTGSPLPENVSNENIHREEWKA